MKITKEINLANFEPWSGAIDTFDKIYNAGKIDELEWILEDLYPEGMDETELNDLLWFDDEWILETLGIDEDDEGDEDDEELY